MSADNYYLVVHHPQGGFTAVHCSASVEYEHECPAEAWDDYTMPTPQVVVFDQQLEEKYEKARAMLREAGVHDDTRRDLRLQALEDILPRVGIFGEPRHHYHLEQWPHPNFYTVEAATAYASEQYAEYGVSIHPDVQAQLAVDQATREETGWVDPVNRQHLQLNDAQFAELVSLLDKHPESAPALRELLTPR